MVDHSGDAQARGAEADKHECKSTGPFAHCAQARARGELFKP